MFDALGRLVVSRPRIVLLSSLVFLVVSGALGASVAQELSTGGFANPNDESAIAQDLLEDEFDSGLPNYLVLVTAAGGSIDDNAVAAQGLEATQTLAANPNVIEVTSYWASGQNPALRSVDGARALVVGTIPGDTHHVTETVEELRNEVDSVKKAAKAAAAVPATTPTDATGQVSSDLVVRAQAADAVDELLELYSSWKSNLTLLRSYADDASEAAADDSDVAEQVSSLTDTLTVLESDAGDMRRELKSLKSMLVPADG